MTRPLGLPSPQNPWIKVCGLRTFAGLEVCAAAGATHVGFNTWPRSPRCAEPGRLSRLVEAARRLGLIPVLVSVSGSMLPEGAAAGWGVWLQRATPIRPDLRSGFLGLVEARAVRPETAAAKSWGDALLLDAHGESLPGGTGRAVPRELILCAPRPFVLAGGLTPDTVAGAVESYGPAGVDAASGLESSPGTKDPGRVRAFCSAARDAYRDLQKKGWTCRRDAEDAERPK